MNRFWLRPTVTKRRKVVSVSEDLRRFPGIKDTAEEILFKWNSEENLRRDGVVPTERFPLLEASDD
ncbi:MAG: hypothetical protein GY906_24690 [bacterium]|nr:hypothetical protein [bacterium]